VNFARLQRPDVVAVVASLALLLVMAADWYSTVHGEEARRVQDASDPQGALGGEAERKIDEDAEIAAEGYERNAWQADGAIDRVIVLVLLLAYGSALLSAFLRAAGRRVEPPYTPAAFGALMAGLGALLIAYRIWQEPGLDAFNTVEGAAPLAALLASFLSLVLATAYRGEESGRAWKRMERVDAEAAAAAAEPPPAAPTT
jgi:hypothetical protein